MTGPKMPTQPDRQPATEERPASVLTVSSKQLLQGGRELRIIHDGQSPPTRPRLAVRPRALHQPFG